MLLLRRFVTVLSSASYSRSLVLDAWFEDAVSNVAENRPDHESPPQLSTEIPAQIDLPSYTGLNCTHSGLFFERNDL